MTSSNLTAGQPDMESIVRMVSATGRNRRGINTFENFIRTDAAINTGGVLVDGSGDLIYLNTALHSESGESQGIGFAIPVTIARQIMQEFTKTGTVERGPLGISVVRSGRNANHGAPQWVYSVSKSASARDRLPRASPSDLHAPSPGSPCSSRLLPASSHSAAQNQVAVARDSYVKLAQSPSPCLPA